MYHVIYMKADYEPWYQFEGWQEYIITKWQFSSEQEAQNYLIQKVEDYQKKYSFAKQKNNYYAFWNSKEVCYCEDCEDELQVYHGLFVTSSLTE